MPYAVLSDAGLVQRIEPTLEAAVDGAEEDGALDVVIDAAAEERQHNPPQGRGALKQLRMPDGPVLAIPESALSLDLTEAWRRIQALMPPFEQTGRTGIQRTFDPARSRATLVKSFFGQNAKLLKDKGSAENIDVQGLNLTPFWMFSEAPDPAGIAAESHLPNMCAGSSAACRHSCLVFSGQNYAADWSIFAKFQKTRILFGDPEAFGRILYQACLRHMASSAKSDFLPAVRLNVLSDVPWELVFPSLFDAVPGLQFYDYTKVPGREPPPNYDLTFSNSGGNLRLVEKHLAASGRVAVVAHVPEWRSGSPISKRENESDESYGARRDEAAKRLWSDRLPKTCTVGGIRYPVIDGDVNDVRFMDPTPAIIALRWKNPGGQAAAQAKGALQLSQDTKFVVEIEDFCGLMIGAVTPSDQPDTTIQTIFSVDPLVVGAQENPRRWATRRAGYDQARAQRLARGIT